MTDQQKYWEEQQATNERNARAERERQQAEANRLAQAQHDAWRLAAQVVWTKRQ
jgi:hypothetical protein